MENKFWKNVDLAILEETFSRFGTSKKQMEKLGESTNLVYEYKRGDESFILRITHSSKTKIEYMLGEFDWVQHLINNGVSASKAIYSKNGKYIESLLCEDGSYFLVTSFEKAKGVSVKSSDWDSKLFEQWGKTLGRMHMLSKRYILSKTLYRRPTNTEKYHPIPRTKDILFTGNIIDNVVKKQQELIDYSLEFPQDIDSFGLIHGDFEDGNFFIDRGEIKVFDFDDCHYNWFMFDIVTILRQASWMLPVKQMRFFLVCFFKGYFSENHIASFWFEQIQYFFKWKELTSYVSAHERLDIDTLSEEEKGPLELMRNWLLNDIPWDGLSEMLEILKDYDKVLPSNFDKSL